MNQEMMVMEIWTILHNNMKTLMNTINSWFQEPEVQEAERFEDWFARINPTIEISADEFNEFHSNLRNSIKENYGNTESNKELRN